MKTNTPEWERDWEEFYIFITNPNNWKNGRPVYKGYMYLTVGNTIKAFIRQVIKQERDDIREKIRVVMFLYEHFWPEQDDEKVCERCKNIVKNNTPCKDSPHYSCWKSLNSILDYLKNK